MTWILKEEKNQFLNNNSSFQITKEFGNTIFMKI